MTPIKTFETTQKSIEQSQRDDALIKKHKLGDSIFLDMAIVYFENNCQEPQGTPDYLNYDFNLKILIEAAKLQQKIQHDRNIAESAQ